jgi:hypothetical protein
MDNEVERRSHPRFSIKWPITVFRNHGPLEGETRNISLTGLFISSYESLHLNEHLQLSLNPPIHKPILVSGEVVWTDSEAQKDTVSKCSSGFSFGKITDADRSLLEDLITVQINQQ